MPEKINLNGVQLTLGEPDTHESQWIDYNDYVRQLEAAWLRLSDVEVPLNPRIVGEPGLGKTTLACAVARRTGRDVYIFQCTMDTRPEDLVITPVLTGDKQIEYRASTVVTAMLRGAIVLLDEANRMPERSWASLAPLMDDRRYIESEVAALKIQAHPNFRLCVTMNADASRLPGQDSPVTTVCQIPNACRILRLDAGRRAELHESAQGIAGQLPQQTALSARKLSWIGDR